jgi:ABC-type transport system substrate-binding protein
MMWQLGSSAAAPDGRQNLARLFGPEIGSQNMSHFQLDAFDTLYRRMQEIPDGPERSALFFEAKRLATAYMPTKSRVHRIDVDLLHPWVVGYRRPLFWQEWWHMIDIDESRKPH